MVKIRLRRMGAKKNPFYRVVVADSRFPRDGRRKRRGSGILFYDAVPQGGSDPKNYGNIYVRKK